MRSPNTVCQRVRALKYVFEQGFVCLSDLKKHLNSQADEESFRVYLYQLGLTRLRHPYISHPIWRLTDPKLIKELHSCFSEYHQSKAIKINPSEIPHALELNKIRFALSNHVCLRVQDWKSEYFIRSLPLFARSDFPYRKIPDAVCTHQNPDGTLRKFFVEHERVLKSKQRYIEIFRHYANRTDVIRGSVIYVCSNEIVKTELKKIVKELFGKGVINSLEEVFQFVDYYQLIATNNGGIIC